MPLQYKSHKAPARPPQTPAASFRSATRQLSVVAARSAAISGEVTFNLRPDDRAVLDIFSASLRSQFDFNCSMALVFLVLIAALPLLGQGDIIRLRPDAAFSGRTPATLWTNG